MPSEDEPGVEVGPGWLNWVRAWWQGQAAV